MSFWIGDLVILCIVLLVLAVFRSIDKNNRSIEKLKRFSDRIIENLSAFVEEKTAHVKDLSTALSADLKSGGELLKHVRETEEALAARSQGFQSMQKRLADYDQALGELVSMSGRVEQNLKRIRDESDFVEGVGKRLKEAGAYIERLDAELPSLMEKFRSVNRADLHAAVTEVLDLAQERAEGIHAEVAGTESKVKDFAAYVARLESRMEQGEKEHIAGFAKAIDAQFAEAARRGETLEDEVFSRLRDKIQSGEASLGKAIETVQLRLQDYEGEVDYRFKKLEEIGADIGTLEKSMKDSMENAACGSREEMKALASRLSEEWRAEIAAVQSEKAKLAAGVNELAEGLAALKSGAYQDVSSKLKVFEDEFFSDLRVRSAAMHEKLEGWQSDVEKRISEIALGYAVEREKLEKNYQEDLRGSFETFRKNSTEEISRVERQVSELSDGVKERISASDESLAALRESLKSEMDKTRRDSAAFFERELAAARDTVDASTKKMRRDVEQALKELSGELESGRKELAEALGASQAEVTVWQGRTRQQMTETEAQLNARISALASDAESAIGNIRDEFAAQKEELIVASNGERMELKNELDGLSERMAAFQAELDKNAENAVDSLHKELETFQLESQKRMRDVQSEVEARIKDFKLLLTENRDKAESMQEKLFGKIEESYRLLSVNLGEIDKRVKGFASQTKIFERADSLKISLESSIEEMKKELAKLNVERAELADIEAQLSKTRRMADEVSGKLGRFLAEKRRIEDMDGEFKKILTMSRDVDLKLDTLSSSNDTLQQIQAKIRLFEEMGREVENGFERLENKKEIIGVTAEGVEKNFQRLESLDKVVSTAAKEAESVSLRLQGLRTELETMAVSKKDADAVMRTIGNLEETLTDLESRLEKAQSSREWLARTETRFEEIGKQAQEQVRLLESILKSESKKEKKDHGAPPLDKRETVIKLSHQGWSVQEISRVTQLSRGEVELILELAPKV